MLRGLLLCLCASALFVSGSAAQTTQIRPSAIDPRAILGRADPQCGSAPDPSRIFGYFAFTDPSTGQVHVPYTTTYGAPQASGYPTYAIRFRSRPNPAVTFDVPHQAGAGLRGAQVGPDGEPIALRYSIQLNADRRASNPIGEVTITYNPDLWCFWSVEILNAGAPYNAMLQRSEPLPGLPDF